MILAPYGKVPGAYPSEIGYSYGGNGTFLCPHDPYYNQRGEVGFYHDTQLGSTAEYNTLLASLANIINSALPKASHGVFGKKRYRGVNGLGRSLVTDFDLYPTYGYVPQMDGFVQFKEGDHPGSWIPPNGYDPAGVYGPPTFQPGTGSQLQGPSDLADIPPANIDPEVAKVLQAMTDQNAKMFTLSLVTTIAIGISAIITIIRNSKALRQEAHAIEALV